MQRTRWARIKRGKPKEANFIVCWPGVQRSSPVAVGVNISRLSRGYIRCPIFTFLDELWAFVALVNAVDRDRISLSQA